MFNAMLCELIVPDDTRTFWQAFKDMYITHNNIAFIKKTGLPMFIWEKSDITTMSGRLVSAKSCERQT